MILYTNNPVTSENESSSFIKTTESSVCKNNSISDKKFKILYVHKGGYSLTTSENCYNVYYIISGKGISRIDGIEHFVGQGTYIIVQPNIEYQIKNISSDDLVILNIKNCKSSEIEEFIEQ
jgi:mannose-6-phosphate isomerase-like protein (cupin superfamily)